MKTFPWRCIIFLTPVNRYDLRANREPHAIQVQHPIFFSRKFVSCKFAFWPPFRPPLRTPFSSWTPIHRRIFPSIAWLNSDTPENFTLLDWTPIHRRYLWLIPVFSDTTEWEEVIIKEDTRNSATRARAKAKTEEKTKTILARRGMTVLNDGTAHHLRPRQSTPLHSFYALLCTSMEPLSRSKTNFNSCNVLFTFPSGFPGFCDMVELCYIQLLYLGLWVNCSIFLNSSNIRITVWLILPVTMNELVFLEISTLEKSDSFASSTTHSCQGRTGKLRIRAVLHTTRSLCDVESWLGFNDKGRVQLAVINQSPCEGAVPHLTEWISTELNEADVDDFIRHNGSYATTNVFFRIQSGHSGLTAAQREELSPPYDFRHNTLMHKTTKHKWNQIKGPSWQQNRLKPFGRDIHLVPTEFLYSDPEMLRNYGERILIFNMHDPATREAFSTARENTKRICPWGLWACGHRLDWRSFWLGTNAHGKTFYNPRCRLDKVKNTEVNDAEKMCKYFSKVYQQRSCSFDDLEPNLRDSVIGIETPTQNITCKNWGILLEEHHDFWKPIITPADVQRSKEVRKDVIIEIVEDVAEQIEQKKKIKAKAMPKPDPPDLPAKSDPAKLQAKTKPPSGLCNWTSSKSTTERASSHMQAPILRWKWKKSRNHPPTLRWRNIRQHQPPILLWKRRAATRFHSHHVELHRHLQLQVQLQFHLQVHLLRKFQNHLRIHQGNLNVQRGQPHSNTTTCTNSPRTRATFSNTASCSEAWPSTKFPTLRKYEPLPRRRRETPSDDVEMRPSFSYIWSRFKFGGLCRNSYIPVWHSAWRVHRSWTSITRSWDRIMDLVTRGLSTGSRMLDRMLLHGPWTLRLLTVWERIFSSLCSDPGRTFFIGKIRGRQECCSVHHLCSTLQIKNFPSRSLTHWRILDEMCWRDGLCYGITLWTCQLEFSITTTYYLTMVVLNLGNMKRIPYFANGTNAIQVESVTFGLRWSRDWCCHIWL